MVATAKKSLLKTLLDELGFESPEDFGEEFVTEGVVPGICRSCRTVEENCEPDATANYCNGCGENKVVSGLILMGVM